ncbi:MAG: GxxExxY protein [Opitutaceae bacterium]|jgi:GxxExxY protein|nr:GxxExxY protein [Opitutaceae bacterium]
MNDDLIYKDEVYKIMGACFSVYKEKGNGYTEPVYQDSMEIELDYLKIPFDTQRNYPIYHRSVKLKHSYTPDLLCYDKIILELKAVKKLTPEHRAQVINYLKVTGCKVGLLVNFCGYPQLEWERLVNTGVESANLQ